MTMPHFNILIATPGRSMEAEYVKSLVSTISYLEKMGISYLYLNEYSSQVHAAREATIMGSKFLNVFETRPVNGEVTYDKVIWIDSDISWTPQQFMSLYESELEIVSGLYINEDGVPVFNYDENFLYFDYQNLANKTKPFEISSVGFGFIAIKYGIFENIERPWFNILFHRIENEDKTKEIFVPLGEDISWCKKAKDLGYKIYLDPNIKVAHNKKIRISYEATL